jgi:hypothetical protein
MLGKLFDSEDVSSKFLRNFDELLPDYKAQYSGE